MIRLAVLLMGAPAMRARWRILAALGAAWAGLGALIILDGSDGVTVVAVETFGLLLVAEGLIAATAAAAGRAGARLRIAKAIALIGLGLLIIDVPWRNDIANSLLFGLAFLIDAAIRIAAALLLRFARWPWVIAGGIVEFGLGLLAVTDWPVSFAQTVPFCVGVALLLSGYGIVRLAWPLRALTPGDSVTALPLFSPRRWYPTPAPMSKSVAEPVGPLVIHVWTPSGSIRPATYRPVIDRYIAAVDRAGRISTGHAALQCGSLYVSHYPAQEIDWSPTEFVRGVRDAAGHDVPGRFQPSYAEEAAAWCEADAQIVFTRYDGERLRRTWEAYRQNAAYNLVERNCSVAVAVMLDAALEGVSSGGWLRFARLLIDPDLWLAALLRARAEAMTWTPGLILDYARALQRVLEPEPLPLAERIAAALRRYRAARLQAAGTAPLS